MSCDVMGAQRHDTMLLYRPIDEGVPLIGGAQIICRYRVGINPAGDARVRVSQALRHGRNWHATRNQIRGQAMAQ